MAQIETGQPGQMLPGDAGGQYGAWLFMVQQMLSRVRTAALVKVISCTNSGGASSVGLVDVQPLVQQVDSSGVAVDLPQLYGLPYFRIQGGANAVILDPQAGDVGIAVFCDRDISTVKKTMGKKSPPGSGSRHSISDGIYLGGVLNGTPSQFIAFTDSGITIHSSSEVNIVSTTLKHNGVNIGATHIHGGIVSGSAKTLAPE